MRRLLAFSLSLTILTISGCSASPEASQVDASPTLEDEAASDKVPETIAKGLVFDESPDWDLSDSPSPVETCKLPDMRPEEVRHLWRNQIEGDLVGAASVGFPRKTSEVPIMGSANIIFAKVAFRDAPPSDLVSDDYIRDQLRKIQKASEHWSEGKFRYEYQIVDGWVEVPVDHWDYQIIQSKTGNEDPHQITLSTQDIQYQVAQLIIDSMPKSVDFASADMIAIYWSPNVKAFKSGITPGGKAFETPIGMRQIE
ncbi:MAG TPA: hypothetical protein VIB61_02035, partial [Microbacteriaceae bacterium]